MAYRNGNYAAFYVDEPFQRRTSRRERDEGLCVL